MKNLKKALALVLAIALCFSLVTIAGATNYDDYADASSVPAEYAAAVDVAVGLKVINGTDGNKLNLDGNLTRAEAAKILTVLNLGTKVAASVDSKTVDTGFSDTKGNWASGYIAYCASQGYLVGSNGKFEPDAELTGYAFGKMLLNVLGYGLSEKTVNGNTTTVNKYEGDQWAIFVAVDADAIGLYDGVSSTDLNSALARKDAMQMVFNALKASTDASTDNAETALQPKTYALASEFELTSTTASTDSTADYGRPVTTYTATGLKNNVVVADTPVLTYNGPVAYGTIFTDLGLKTAAENVSTDNIKVREDGADASAASYGFTKGDTTNKIGTAGSKVEVYKYVDSGTTKYVVIIINTYVKKLSAETDVVAAVAATSTTDGTPAFIRVTSGTSAAYGTAGTFETDAFKKNDVILYTKSGSNIVTVEKPSVVTGKIAKYTDTTITVGSTTLTMAAKKDATVAPGTILFATEKAFYVDSNNVVYYAGDVDSATTTIDGYFYVEGYQVSKSGDSGDLFNEAVAESYAAKAKVITTAGVEQVVNLDVIATTAGNTTSYSVIIPNTSGVKTQALSAAINYTTTNAQWLAYTVENGVYTLCALPSGAKTGSITSASNKATSIALGGTTMYITSKTVATYINTVDGTKTMTGTNNIVINAGASADAAQVLALYDTTSGVASNIYAIKTTTDVSGSTANYAYVVSKGATTENGTEVTYYVGGETKVLATATDVASAMNVGSVYDLTISSANVVTAKGEEITLDAKAAVTVAEEGYFVAGSTQYTYADGCKVYNITTGTPGTVDTIEVGDNIQIAVKEGSAVSLVYIVD